MAKYYKGMSIKRYCSENGFCYISALRNIRKGYDYDYVFTKRKNGRPAKYCNGNITVASLGLDKKSRAKIYYYARRFGNLKDAISFCEENIFNKKRKCNRQENAK